MNKLLLALFGAAAFSPAFAGEPANEAEKKENIESVVSREIAVTKIVPEKFDKNTNEIILWKHVLGQNILYKFKTAKKLDIDDEQKIKQLNFAVSDEILTEHGLRIVTKVYKIEGEKIIEQESVAAIPLLAQKIHLPKTSRLAVACTLNLQPYYMAELNTEPKRYFSWADKSGYKKTGIEISVATLNITREVELKEND
ncbi:hypothetical protein KY316_02730, partial [Candidatus Woesearchaeota archaeon]|nr:hypothetical protein [Candidatus Woesearchaeota archaeon]